MLIKCNEELQITGDTSEAARVHKTQESTLALFSLHLAVYLATSVINKTS